MSESRRANKTTVLVGLVLASCAVYGQKAQSPELDEILQRLESNRLHYHAVVPSFFCDEHAVSQQTNRRGGRISSATDSTFRLKRTVNPDDTTTLVESREVKTIDGRPAKGDNVAGSAVLHEAFSSGLAFVSISQAACMRYTLEPIKPGSPTIIQFSTLPGKPRPGCLLQEQGTGRVLIDPATLQIARLELTMPHHIIFPGSRTQMQVEGPWTIWVNYEPVELESQAFWMPKRIFSGALSPGSDGGNWSFNATYSNFHKLEVTTKILPGEVAPTQ